MKNTFTTITGYLFLLLLLYTATAFPGSIKGTIKDAETQDPLPYSNVVLAGTSWGSAADKEGNFTIKNVPAGSYTLRASYVGYKTAEVTVQVTANGTLDHDFLLEPESVEGETVVITAQAEGQLAAINEQLNSIAVKSVVSSAKIKELPDNNAAESVSRLPGVSLIRTGGEGSKVVIRGLSPQFNQVTIDGVEMSSNVASGNNLVSTDKSLQESSNGFGSTINVLGDRAADLSMISSSMLGGIEVIKAITPDMDATLIGGVVNFSMRKAQKGVITRNIQNPYVPVFEINTQGGYNNLKDEVGNYKLVGSVEQRFFNGALGVFLQASNEQRNLSANELGADYRLSDKDHGDIPMPDLRSLILTDVFRERKRQGYTLVMDYQHSGGEIGLMNFFSTSKTNSTSRDEEIRSAPTNEIYYNIDDTQSRLNVISNLLSVKQDISFLHIDMKLSHSYSKSENPLDVFFNFWQDDAGLSGDLTKIPPTRLAELAVVNPENTNLDRIQTSETFSKDRSLASSLDFTFDIPVSQFVNSKLKVGGSYLHRKREYDYNIYSGSQLYSGGAPVVSRIIEAFPQLSSGLNLPAFADPNYKFGKFLDGDYSLNFPSASSSMMRQIIPFIRGVYSKEGYRENKLGSHINDYNGTEEKSAVYGMVTVNLGDQITILPGVRYQNLTTEYTALRAKIDSSPDKEYSGKDTTIEQKHGYLLPMLHVRYKPLDWLQVHFAYTNTLNYPDYSAITPRYYIGTGFIQYNNFRLKPARAENFDLIVSAYANEIGLLSVNGFKKNIKDLIFYSRSFVTDLNKYPDIPTQPKALYEFFTYINNPIKIDVWGIETDWQTNFWYLPEPLNGLVLSVNYTHIFSEAEYPKSEYIAEYDDEGNLKTTINDTLYANRLLNQPNDIVNISLGYDYADFSARISMLYQDNIFKQPNFWLQERIASDKFTRFDLSVKQKLPWFGLQVYLNVNNITGAMDTDVNLKNYFPASEQHYGMTMDMGVVFRL